MNATIALVGPVTHIPKYDGICEDCHTLILSGSEDAIPYFDDRRCKECQATMYRYMEGECDGCGASNHDLRNGEAVHQCECGWDLSEKECVENNGMCASCLWLMS